MKAIVTTKLGVKYDFSGIVDSYRWGGGLKRTVDSAYISFPCEKVTEWFPAIPEFTDESGSLNGASLLITDDSDSQIFEGIVVEDDRAAQGSRTIEAYDRSWYLKQSEQVFQFDTTDADAIREVLGAYDLVGENIPSYGIEVKEFYLTNTGAEIIKDILNKIFEQKGIELFYEMQDGKVVFLERGSETLDMEFSLYDGGDNYPIADSVGSASKRMSIKDMVNQVRIVTTYRASPSTEAIIHEIVVEDENMINDYGIIQRVLTNEFRPGEMQLVEDLQDARNRANRILAKHSKVSQDITLSFIGHPAAKKGRLLTVSEETTDVDGEFIIIDAAHTVSDDLHTMSLTLEVW